MTLYERVEPITSEHETAQTVKLIRIYTSRTSILVVYLISDSISYFFRRTMYHVNCISQCIATISPSQLVTIAIGSRANHSYADTIGGVFGMHKNLTYYMFDAFLYLLATFKIMPA